MSNIPKDIFTLRRTHLFLDKVEKALNALAEKTQREPTAPRKAAEWEVQALVYDLLALPANAAKCRRERDRCVEQQRAIMKGMARRPRTKKIDEDVTPGA